MLRQVVEFESGMRLEITDCGFKVQRPDGSLEAFDPSGNLIPKANHLISKVKVGDYIECVSEEDYFVVSSKDSGYSEDQIMDVKKASTWQVISKKDGEILAISTESVGELKLSGLTGYLNSGYILNKIAQACADNNAILAATTLGGSNNFCERLHFDDITTVKEYYPYNIFCEKDYDISVVKFLGMKFKTKNGIWLDARRLKIVSGDYCFGVHIMKPNGEVSYETLNKSYIAGNLDNKTASYDVYPMALFDPYAEICKGNGSEEEPYKFA